jgi:transcription initiation factor IIE alpha subunit
MLVSKVGFDNKQQEALYAINWTGSFHSLQASLCERIVEGSYGSPHFAQTLRVLRLKGFLDEMELTKLCLLPQKNIRSVLNRLVADGVIKLQEMPQKGGHTTMYGVSIEHVTDLMACKIAKAIHNVMLAGGKLGKVANLSLEYNLLAL